MLECGMNAQQVIDCVTINPINFLNLPFETKIKEGYIGSLTFYKIEKTSKEVIDSDRNKFSLKDQFIPTGLFHKSK
jgi:predicted amidohydrolase